MPIAFTDFLTYKNYVPRAWIMARNQDIKPAISCDHNFYPITRKNVTDVPTKKYHILNTLIMYLWYIANIYLTYYQYMVDILQIYDW